MFRRRKILSRWSRSWIGSSDTPQKPFGAHQGVPRSASSADVDEVNFERFDVRRRGRSSSSDA
jgi:hypothetical protein